MKQKKPQNTMKMNKKETTIKIIDELRASLEYGRALYNPELGRRLGNEAIDSAECMNKLLEKRIVLSHKGYHFFNPEFSRMSTLEIIKNLKFD